MRKLLIGFFIIKFSFINYCQTYVPMPMQNCYWQITNSSFCSWAGGTPPTSVSNITYKVFPNNDTIINFKRYIKFYALNITNNYNSNCPTSGASYSGYFGALRQDSVGKKVFLISPNQTIENLLYNFNYSKGDTVKTSLGTYTLSPPPGGDPYRIVDSIYYKSYSDGICRKTFRLKPYIIYTGYQITENSYFTEGIGNEVGLTERRSEIYMSNSSSASMENWSSFLSINNTSITASPTNTCSQSLGLETKNLKQDLMIYPNPAQNEISITSNDSNERTYMFTIYDLIGNEILKSNSKTIRIEPLSNGCYFIKCWNTDTKEFIIRKFIKH